MNKFLKSVRFIRTNHGPVTTTRPSSSSSRVPPRVFPSTGFVTIPASIKVDEENWAWYRPESYYPVRIGDVLHSRYQILYKLGFGTTSTVWMCRDLELNTYVCLKSMVCDYPSAQREIDAYEALSKAVATIPSFQTRRVRRALDHFHLRHKEHDYHFLVHQPLGFSLDDLMEMYYGQLPVPAVFFFAQDFLATLEAIHSAKIVHTDIQTANILFSVHDPTVFQETEEDEIAHPSPRKVTDESVVYTTKELCGNNYRMYGKQSRHALCDFGEARSLAVQDTFTDMIQPPPARAPEVFLGLPWGAPVDIWAFGCLLWQLATGKPLFPRKREENEHEAADKAQLASMAALLGPPPLALLAQSGDLARKYFKEDGSAIVDVPQDTLESRLASSLSGYKWETAPDKVQTFLALIRRILVWEAHKRPSASELLKDAPWDARTAP